VFARNLRLELAREHLDRRNDDDGDLIDPISAFDCFANAANALQRWTENGRVGDRPAGRLRPYAAERLPARTLRWADPLYRIVADPDGRPLRERLHRRF
jgi:hypothetical protein